MTTRTRSLARVAGILASMVAVLILPSCLLFTVLDATRPRPFVSSQPMPAEGVEEVYRFTAVITGTDAERSEAHTKMIQDAFTTGETFTITSQKTPDSEVRAFIIFFSKRGERMAVVVSKGVVVPPGGSSKIIDSVYVENNLTGATVKVLDCPGPFVGHDLADSR